MTAYQMLIKRAQLQSNETVLIYGGSSGVGSAAIQICRELGAKVIATAGNDEKCGYSEKMGAHHSLNHNQDKWLDEVKNITNQRGVNVVFEHIGSATWNQSQKILEGPKIILGKLVVFDGAKRGKRGNSMIMAKRVPFLLFLIRLR